MAELCDKSGQIKVKLVKFRHADICTKKKKTVALLGLKKGRIWIVVTTIRDARRKNSPVLKASEDSFLSRMRLAGCWGFSALLKL